MQDWIANSLQADADTLGVIAVHETEPWETITLLYKEFSPTLLLGIFPSYLQLDLRFYRAVRSLGMSSLTVAQEQMQAGLALVGPLSIGGIVTTAGAFARCLDDLRTLSPQADPYFQVILGVHERPFKTAARVFFEMHITPGIPLLYQCGHLAQGFHATKKFFADTFPSPVTLREQPCVCGNNSLIELES